MTSRLPKIMLLALVTLVAAAALASLLSPAEAQGGPVSVSFPSPGVPLRSGDTVTVEISASGLEAGDVDTVQIALEHEVGDIEITGFRCAGLYDGATATDLIDVTPGASVSFTCSDQGAPSAASGVVAEIDVTRVGAGEAEVSFLQSGPFRTAFISQGAELPLDIANSLQVSDVLWRPVGFYFEPPELELGDGETADIEIYSGQIDVTSASAVQVTIAHDSSVLEITNADCVDLYEGASITDLASVENGTATSFACTLAGGPLNEYGVIATVTIGRVGPGDTELSFVGSGPFRTAFIDDGAQTSQGVLGTMTVTDAVAEPSPSPSPSPSPIATATTPPSGGGGGGGFTPQPTSTPVPSGPSAPSVPLNLTAAPLNGAVEITWEAPASNGGAPISSYRIVNLNTANVITVQAPADSAVISGLTNGVAYSFQVQAVNFTGAGPSAIVGPVTPASEPSAPLNVQAMLSGSDVLVTWAAPQSDGGSPVTGYTVTLLNGTEVASTGAGSTQATVSGLTAGSSYSFVVYAVNAIGTGPASGAAGPVTIPSTSGSPGDAPAAITSVPQSSATNSALGSAVTNAFGAGVTAPNMPITLSSSSTGLKATIALSGLDSSVSGSAQFNVVSDDLMIETDASGAGTITTRIGQGLSVTGAASVSVEQGSLSVTINQPKLAYAPSASGETGSLSGVEFSVGLSALPEGAGLTSTFSTTLPGELTGAVFAIGSTGNSVIGDASDDLAAVVTVTKNGIENSDLGDNTVTMFVNSAWYEDRVEQGKRIVITKISDGGDVFTQEASCVTSGAGYRCSATFSGAAGGFSTFGLVALTELMPPTPTPVPRTPTPAATPTSGAQPTASPMAEPTQEPDATSTPEPTPQPFPTTSVDPVEASSGGGFPLWGWMVVAVVALAVVRAGMYVYGWNRSS